MSRPGGRVGPPACGSSVALLGLRPCLELSLVILGNEPLDVGQLAVQVLAAVLLLAVVGVGLRESGCAEPHPRGQGREPNANPSRPPGCPQPPRQAGTPELPLGSTLGNRVTAAGRWVMKLPCGAGARPVGTTLAHSALGNESCCGGVTSRETVREPEVGAACAHETTVPPRLGQ